MPSAANPHEQLGRDRKAHRLALTATSIHAQVDTDIDVCDWVANMTAAQRRDLALIAGIDKEHAPAAKTWWRCIEMLQETVS